MPQKKSLTWVEVLVVLFIISVLAALLLPSLTTVKDCSRSNKCKSHLRQLAQAMQLYVDNFSRGSRYPPFSGAEFWSHLYRTGVEPDAYFYLCPSTDDDNANGADLMTPEGTAPPDIALSYGGRINALGQGLRIFTQRNASDTPIGCDDDEAGPNHDEVVNVVFLDTSAKEFIVVGKNADPALGGARIGAGILSVCSN